MGLYLDETQLNLEEMNSDAFVNKHRLEMASLDDLKRLREGLAFMKS